MSTLLLDVGNSRIKWAQLDEGGFRFLGQDRFSEVSLRTVLKTHYDSVWVSNVAGSDVDVMLQSIVQKDLHFAKTEAVHDGLANGYAQPMKLGVDRWLAMLAAWNRVRSGCLVIDCGTAISIDRIDPSGQHLGGLLFPGLRMMRRALCIGTDALPDVTDAEVQVSGELTNNTIDGITQGTLMGVKAFIESQVLQENVGDVFLTGGDAMLIEPVLSCEVDVDPHLVLKGLSLYV